MEKVNNNDGAHRILLVEDDQDIAENVIDYLQSSGYGTDYAMSGELALELFRDNIYDAVVLDINLQGMSGFDVCYHIRNTLRLNIPVLMLTARVMLDDKKKGFECGADDYLTKPFDLAELVMRIRALMRRSNRKVTKIFQIDDLTLDPENGIVTRAGHELILPHVCFRILRRLMEKSPGIVEKDDLLYDIWRDDPPMSDSLKSHFYSLRQIVDKPFDKQLLHSIRGRGYKIDDSHDEESEL